jgi:hypothetical protein
MNFDYLERPDGNWRNTVRLKITEDNVIIVLYSLMEGLHTATNLKFSGRDYPASFILDIFFLKYGTTL